MIIKEMDDRTDELAALDVQARESTGSVAKRAKEDLLIRRAGMKGERESAYLIDFHFKATANWFVIHDLRLEQDGRTAQIDHLLFNRALECYVLESKHFHAGLKITDEGEFLRWNSYRKTFEGMASPLAQNERHVAVLKDVFKAMEMPTRLGLRLMPRLLPYVLVSPKSRIDRAAKFDSSAVIKADKIRQQFVENLDSETTLETVFSAARYVSAATARDIAERLAALHRPVRWPVTQRSPASISPPQTRLAEDAPTTQEKEVNEARAVAGSLQEPALDGPECKKCGERKGAILHGKYGYYFKCSACQGNTKVAFSCKPGHNPRLRKAKERFFRECADCETSQLYFVNE